MPTLPAALETQIPRIGDILDSKFRITGVLGSGGMGCVYLAEHLSLRRPVALKLLHPEVEGIEEVTLRFEREAFATGRVDHPNCVNVSDFGRLEDGTLYMVLEVLDGVSLFDLIEKEGEIEWRRALHIVRHVLSALACAHEAGIVHRDVKPENVILVDQEDDPDFAKILDFGIAKLFDGANLQSNDPQLTQLGVTIGTPTYIAPEQAFGQPIDARADLYALSVMLYEMIAGVPPFEADEVVQLLSMHTSADVPPFRKTAPGARVPKSVETLIRDGLEKNKDDRVPTADEYIARIDRILADLLQARIHSQQRFGHVGSDRKLEIDASLRVIALGRHLEHALDCLKLVLLLQDDLAFDVLRARPRPRSPDGEHGPQHARRELLRHVQQGHCAE